MCASPWQGDAEEGRLNLMNKLLTSNANKTTRKKWVKEYTAKTGLHPLPSGYYGLPFYTRTGIFSCLGFDLLHVMGSHGLATRAMDSFWLLAFSDCKGRDADERGAEFQRRNEAMVSYLQTLPQITDGIGHRLPRFDGGIFGISQCTASVRLAMLQHLEILLDVSVSLDGILGCTRSGDGGDSQPLSNFESEAAFEAGWKVVRHTSALARELYDTETDLTNDTLKSIDAAVRGYWIVARHAFTHVNSAIRTANSKKQKNYEVALQKFRDTASSDTVPPAKPKYKREYKLENVQKIQQTLLAVDTIQRHGPLHGISSSITEKMHMTLLGADKRVQKVWRFNP